MLLVVLRAVLFALNRDEYQQLLCPKELLLKEARKLVNR
jgi:hypothetical protein